MLRRNWRDQALIGATIATAVAVSVAGSLLAYHSADPGTSLESLTVLSLDGEADEVDRIVARFGDRAVESWTGEARFDGSPALLALRGFDPTNPLLSPRVDVVDGRRPTAPDEIIVTDGALTRLAAQVGESVRFEGAEFRIVGEFEDPTNLSDEYVLFDPRRAADFPVTRAWFTGLGADTAVELIDSDPGTLDDFWARGSEIPPREDTTFTTTALATFAMLLIGFLASAGFAVIARGRIRQYGLLGAIGADERHLRGAAAFNGFALSVIAAAIGLPIGLLVARGLFGFVEEGFNHRIDFHVPLSTIAPLVVVTIVITTLASWWPARSMSRQPVVEALAARRPRTPPVRKGSAAGLVAAVAGNFLLAYAARREDAAGAIPAIAGIVLVVVGVLLLAPAAIALIGRVSGLAALPVRIAGRDLARFQSRGAAGLAAIVLALAIPMGIGVVTASVDANPAKLPDDTAIVWVPGTGVGEDLGATEWTIVRGRFLPEDFDPAAAEAAIARIADGLPELRSVPLQVLYDPVDGLHTEGRRTVRKNEQLSVEIPMSDEVAGDVSCLEGRCFDHQLLFVVTPELAKAWDLDLAAAGPTGVLQRGSAQLFTEDRSASGDARFAPIDSATVSIPDFGSLPSTLIIESAVDPALEVTTVGWMLIGDRPLTDDQIALLHNRARDVAEIDTPPSPNTRLATVAAIIGALIGLVILGSSVTLMRGESGDETRVLNVLGAPGLLRRSVAGATAGLLALAGAALALPLGSTALVVVRSIRADLPIAIPWPTLLILFVVFPMTAALTAGLLSGRTRSLT